MGLQDKIIEAVVSEVWGKMKASIGEGGQELLRNPWPMIRGLRGLADLLAQYAQSKGIVETGGGKDGS